MSEHDRHQEHQQKELHIAPMLHYSTREFRQLIRILSKRAVVWTEMVVDDTIQHVHNLDDHLAFDIEQHPIVCQIGGNSSESCGHATSVVMEQYGYDEVNLNIDCPSERVSGKREFGAILMKKAHLAKEIVREMLSNANATTTVNGAQISVKCRIGVDNLDDLEYAAEFIRTLQPVCQRFYLHARKCVLDGLMNARQNRSVPPLNYPRVYELCQMFPDCNFWINGGIKTLEEAKLIAYGKCNSIDYYNSNDYEHQHYNQTYHNVPCDLCNIPNGSCIEPPTIAPHNLRGCMMGRAAIENPCLFHDVDRYYYGDESNPCRNRRQLLEQYCQYIEQRYPRSCHIDDDGDGDIVNQKYQNYCSICSDVYGSPRPTLMTTTSPHVDNSIQTKPKKIKITGPVIAKCLKPVQGVFYGIPSTRIFRRVCDKLGQDSRVRNCGPGYIVRRAMQTVPPDILDQEF